MTNMYFQVCSLFYMIMIMILFFSKSRLKNEETKIFSILSTVNIIGITLDIIIVYLSYVSPGCSPLYILNKFYLIYVSIWTLLFFYYVISITKIKKEKKKKFYFLGTVILFVTTMVILFLPIYLYNKDNVMYTYGPSVTSLWVSEAILVSILAIFVVGNIKKIMSRKYIPLLVLIFLCFIALIVRMIDPGILLTTTIITYINILMYHTIENPDISMIEQLKRNKVLVEKGNEDKSNFLFKLTQEVRKPIDDIIRVNDIMSNAEDRETTDKGIKYIGYNAKQLKVLINEVLDVSKMDAYNIKMMPTTYNIYNVFTEIISRFQSKVNNDIEFRYNISNNIPKMLYGDDIKIKQILSTILQNSVDYTRKGYIDLNVDSIVKNDICRLIISIEDSGCGMSLDKVNELLSLENNLDEQDIKKLDKMNLDLNIATKIIRLLGGQIIIKSELNVGSEFIIAIDQKIEKSNKDVISSRKIEEYSRILTQSKRVLIVDDDKRELDEIVKYLKKYNVEVLTTMYGQDCVDRIINRQKYDLIIMDDEMQPQTGINTLQKLQEIHKFKTPVVIMLDRTKEGIKQHYLNDGFSDYLLKSNFTSEIDKIMKKYL